MVRTKFGPFRAFLGPLWAPCWDQKAKLLIQCTSMTKVLSFAFWIMKIGPLVSEIWPGQSFGGKKEEEPKADNLNMNYL